MILFRHADPRWPFLWETADQPAGRWHGYGDGPVQYLADTPDGAWAEFLRHEEINEPEDVATVRRALWAIEVDDSEVAAEPEMAMGVLTGGPESYSVCQAEAARLRAGGATSLSVHSAALKPGEARGWRVEVGVRPGPHREPRTIVLFGPRPELVGWEVVGRGHPEAHLLRKVRHFRP
ncbi:MAG: RES domain-containing protein [Actinomycetota bacterium]